MKNKLIAAAAAISLLAGCERAAEKVVEIFSGESITIVVPPGYEIAIDGHPVKVFGRDECPKQGPVNMFFGSAQYDGPTNCLVIKPTTKTVLARLAIDGKLINETWIVWRVKHKSFLRRPNGSLVVAYDDFLRASHNDKREKGS